jgi:hypothetical protein
MTAGHPVRARRLDTAAWPALASVSSVLLPTLVIILGAALRLYRFDLIRHHFDCAYPSYQALRILELGQHSILGQRSSVFTDNPALMSYMQAVVLRVVPSLHAVYLVLIALNAAGVALVYFAGRRLLGHTAGTIAALLYAISPWIIYFSRAAWVQGLMPFYMALLAWGLWPGMVGRDDSEPRVLAGLLGLVAMIGSYIQAWGAFLQVGPLLVFYGRRLPRRALFAGLAVLALSLALYAVGVARDWDSNRQQLASYAAEGRLQLNRQVPDHAVRLVSGRDFEFVHTREAANYPLRRNLSTVAHGLLSLALLGGVARAAMALRRPGNERRLAVVLLLWFLMPILAMGVSSRPVHPHYLLLTCPAGHLLAAWGLAGLWEYRRARWPIAALLVAVTLLNSVNQHAAAQQVAARPAEGRLEAWSLQAGTQVGDTIRDLLDDTPRPARMVVDTYGVLVSSLSRTSIEPIADMRYPEYVVLPGDRPLLYVLVNQAPLPGALGPLEKVLAEREIVLVDGTRVVFVQTGPYSREAALALPEVAMDWPGDAGLTLLGYTVEGPAVAGREFGITTYWRVDELPPGHEGRFAGAYYHVWDAEGERHANVSGQGRWLESGTIGDVYIERMRIPLPADLPAGEYRLDVGLFDTIHGPQYLFTSPEGVVPAAKIILRMLR